MYSPVSQLFTQNISSIGRRLRGFLLFLFALAWPLFVQPAQAGYTVTLQQVGFDVVAKVTRSIAATRDTPRDKGMQSNLLSY